MKNILITGVSGFLGVNLVASLSGRSDIRLFGYSRDAQKAMRSMGAAPITMVNDCTASTLEHNHIHTIIHLAGIAHDLSNQYKADDYYEVNHRQTVKLYDAFLKSSAINFVFISSIKAVIDIGDHGVDEDITPNPVTDYGKSKLMAEQYITGKQVQGKNYFILRPVMVHGPGNKGNLNLLYKFVKKGLPYPFGAFDNQRSFLSVDNFNFVIHNVIDSKIASGIYHLSDTGTMSTKDLVRLIGRTVGKRATVLRINKGLIQTLAVVAGKKKTIDKLTENMIVPNQKILNAIGPFPTDIESGLRKTILSFDEK